MRNIHTVIGTEFHRESDAIFRRWEQLEKKLGNFSNHRRFTLRCLSQKITPVSLRLKSNIKTETGMKIIQRAEKQLMDERARSINNTIDICRNLINTCISQLKDIINQEVFEECQEFIKKIRECRHKLF